MKHVKILIAFLGMSVNILFAQDFQGLKQDLDKLSAAGEGMEH